METLINVNVYKFIYAQFPSIYLKLNKYKFVETRLFTIFKTRFYLDMNNLFISVEIHTYV